MIFNVIYAKRKKHVRIYWFYHLSRRCNNPAPLTLLQKKRTIAFATEGRPSSGKQAPRSMIFLKSLAISRILCTFVGNYNIKIKQLWSYWCFFLTGIVAIIGATGEDAERFVREAEENERNPQRRKLISRLRILTEWWNVHENILKSMEEKDLSQSKSLFERNIKNNRCCYVLLS